jgi:hypothetical protein
MLCRPFARHFDIIKMEYEKCYVFQPESTRPAKKRKTEEHGLHASWQLRKKAYEDAWQSQQSRIDVGTCKWRFLEHY